MVSHEGADRPVAVVIGPPGAGKTTVGEMLARRLEVDFRDTDREIERAQGRSISDLFVMDGEPAFRELERRQVKTSLTAHSGVLAVGGGAVMDPQTAQALARHTVVFLQVGIADAAKRVGFDRSRPLMAINPRGQWVKLMEHRRETYERLATLTVDTAGRTPEDVVDEVVRRLGETA